MESSRSSVKIKGMEVHYLIHPPNKPVAHITKLNHQAFDCRFIQSNWNAKSNTYHSLVCLAKYASEKTQVLTFLCVPHQIYYSCMAHHIHYPCMAKGLKNPGFLSWGSHQQSLTELTREYTNPEYNITDNLFLFYPYSTMKFYCYYRGKNSKN